MVDLLGVCVYILVTVTKIQGWIMPIFDVRFVVDGRVYDMTVTADDADDAFHEAAALYRIEEGDVLNVLNFELIDVREV